MCHQAYNQCLLKEGINIAWPSSPRYSCLILFNKQRRFIVFAQPFPKILFFTRLCHDVTLLLLVVLRSYIVFSILWLRYICQKISCYKSMDLQWNCCSNIDLQQLNIGSYSSQIAVVINYFKAKFKRMYLHRPFSLINLAAEFLCPTLDSILDLMCFN